MLLHIFVSVIRTFISFMIRFFFRWFVCCFARKCIAFEISECANEMQQTSSSRSLDSTHTICACLSVLMCACFVCDFSYSPFFPFHFLYNCDFVCDFTVLALQQPTIERARTHPRSRLCQSIVFVFRW